MGKKSNVKILSNTRVTELETYFSRTCRHAGLHEISRFTKRQNKFRQACKVSVCTAAIYRQWGVTLRRCVTLLGGGGGTAFNIDCYADQEDIF
jgi:hypothetical protein